MRARTPWWDHCSPTLIDISTPQWIMDLLVKPKGYEKRRLGNVIFLREPHLHLICVSIWVDMKIVHSCIPSTSLFCIPDKKWTGLASRIHSLYSCNGSTLGRAYIWLNTQSPSWVHKKFLNKEFCLFILYWTSQTIWSAMGMEFWKLLNLGGGNMWWGAQTFPSPPLFGISLLSESIWLDQFFTCRKLVVKKIFLWARLWFSRLSLTGWIGLSNSGAHISHMPGSCFPLVLLLLKQILLFLFDWILCVAFIWFRTQVGDRMV